MAAILGTSVAADSVKHPFVGEHVDANAVPHENGKTVSMRLGAKPTSYNKHKSHIAHKGIFEPEQPGFFARVSESLFGKVETERDALLKKT